MLVLAYYLGKWWDIFLEPDIESKICGATKLGIIATGSPKRSMVFAQDINLVLPFWGFTCGIFPTTSKNKVKLCRPSKTMTLLKDTHWLLIYLYIYSQKRVTFPLSLIESVNQSSKFWIKICGFHAQVFDWFSRVFHCLFTGFSRSFHALFTLWVWSGICLKLWSPVYIYTSIHWVW